MRLLALDLKAFGPFKNVLLDLSQGSEGLHVIFGGNEAGKSSALRALEAFLFGIGRDTADDFLTPSAKLRVGATLRTRTGEVANWYRRKTGKALVDENDRPLPEGTVWHQWLQALDQSQFRLMFGINRETLEQGGREILAGGGEVGKTLFSAAGLANLPKVQEQLRTGFQEIFLPRGRNQQLSQIFTEIKKARTDFKEQALVHDAWAKVDHDLAEATANKNALETKLIAARNEFRRRTRLRDAHALANERTAILARLGTLDDVPTLSRDFTEERRRVQEQMRLANARIRDQRKALEDLDRQLSTLQVPTALLEDAPEIEALVEKVGEVKKGLLDRIARRREMEIAEHEAREVLRRLHRPISLLDDPAPLRLQANEVERMTAMSNEFATLSAQIETCETQLQRMQRDADDGQTQLEKLPESQDLAALRRVLNGLFEVANLEESLPRKIRETEAIEESLRAGVRRLGLHLEDFAELESLPVPMMATIDQFARNFEEHHQQEVRLQERVDEAEKLETQTRSDLARLESEALIPTLAELAETRSIRDETWQAVRQAWREKKEEIFPTRLAVRPRESLADAFERTVDDADRCADRLRQEAERVHQKAELQSKSKSLRESLERFQHHRQTLAMTHDRLRNSWEEIWQPLGLSSRSPMEMRAWRNDFQLLVAKVPMWRVARADVRDIQNRVETGKTLLANALRQAKVSMAIEDNLKSAVAQVAELVDRNEASARARDQLHQRIETLARDRKHVEADRARAQKKLQDWQARWQPLLSRFELAAETQPAEALAFVHEIQLFWKSKEKADDRRSRINGIDRDVQTFGEHAQTVAKRHLESPPEDAQTAVAELSARLKKALADQRTVDVWRTDHSATRKKLAEAEEASRELEARLQTLCAEARVAVPEELATIEQQAEEKRLLLESLVKVEKQLHPLCSGTPLIAFCQEVLALDMDQAAAELSRLEAEIQEMEASLQQTLVRVGEKRQELTKWSGTATAAETAQKIEDLSANVERLVRTYQVHRVASALLQQTLERYRQKNEGKVLQRAGDHFSTLTRRSFSGVVIDHDGDGQPILVGQRGADGSRVGVEFMSQGTRDQLYLALRIASLEVYLQYHEPVPFVVDDLLVNFDDERAMAAMDVLAELSKKTQVLFFTHHRHLVELACGKLSNSTLFIHELRGEFANHAPLAMGSA